MLKSARFAKHSKFLIKMIDKTVMMLASESETSDDEDGRTVILTDILIKLGKKHVSYGVKPGKFMLKVANHFELLFLRPLFL